MNRRQRQLTASRVIEAVPILLAVRELHHGGIERDVTKIALNIDRSLFAPHVATYQAAGMRFEELKNRGIPVLHLPLTSLFSTGVFSAALRLRSYVREHGIRLVHAYDTSSVFVASLARCLRVPAVLSSTLGNRGLLDPRTRGQVRFTDHLVDRVVVNCKAMRKHMIEDEHFPGDRIELCYNGVDTAEFYPSVVRRPEPVENASLVIGCVCVLRPEKGLDLLQEAFARIRKLRPGTKLLLIGSGGELPKLLANSQRLGIEGDCQFVPATPAIAGFLRAIDIFVLPSYSEAFSNALLEAMACGCGVIGSRVGGTPELIGNNERGLLFEPGNREDLVDKLTMMLTDDALRRLLASRAAEFAKTSLTVEIAARRMATIYQDVLQRKFRESENDQ